MLYYSWVYMEGRYKHTTEIHTHVSIHSHVFYYVLITVAQKMKAV